MKKDDIKEEILKEFRKFWEDIDGCAGCGSDYLVCKRDFHFEAFLSDVIDRVQQETEKEMKEKIIKNLPEVENWGKDKDNKHCVDYCFGQHDYKYKVITSLSTSTEE